MATPARSRALDWSVLAAALSLLGFACSSADDVENSTATGGAAPGTGGSTMGTGGALSDVPGTGGALPGTGGASNSTATPATGGSSLIGGSTGGGGPLGTGGSTGLGGAPGTGGGTGTGINPSTGGRSGTGGGSTGIGGGTSGVGGGTSGVGGSSPATGGATGTAVGSCIQGVDTGDACDPAVDTQPCVRSSRTCQCDASGQWACTPTSGTGGAPGSGGVTGSGGGTGSSGGTSSTSSGGSSGGGFGGATDTGGQTGTSTGGGPSGDVYNPDFVEFSGEDCDIGEPQEVNEPKLPDLFQFLDGTTRMSKRSEWRCRRAELKKAVETYIHGEKPGRPDVVTGTVSKNSISVHVEHNNQTIDFTVQVSGVPANASGPVPAIIGLGGGSLRGAILSEEGVASINYNNTTLSSETSRSGLFSDIYGSTGASAQVGWAWGVSRILDVLVDERDAGRNDIIDPTAIGVTGCSRLGKGAFTIGAFDERIALGIPQESGTGGVSAFRIVNTNPMGPNGKAAQSLASAWSEAQGWFGTAFGNYRNNVNTIPVDTHSLVAMYAPRGLLVLDNSRIGELGSIAQHAATAAGGEVYKALGLEKNVAYHGGNATDPHNHCTFYDSQAEPLRRAIRAHLTKTDPPDGRIEPAAVATADLAEWIQWATPTLEEDLSWDSPPLTN